MTLLFTTIGSAADYGSFGRWLLLTVTLICWGAQFASMSLTCTYMFMFPFLFPNLVDYVAPDRWGAAMGLFILGFVSYGATLVFYAALFPRLARNTRHARGLKEKHDQGELSAEEYEMEESLEKNRISNISTVGHSGLLRCRKRVTILLGA